MICGREPYAFTNPVGTRRVVHSVRTRRLGASLPRVCINSAIHINIHVRRNNGRQVRPCRNAIVTVHGNNVGHSVAMHGVFRKINIRQMFLLRTPGLTSVGMLHQNGTHHTGLCCLHSHINGTAQLGRQFSHPVGWTKCEATVRPGTDS